MIATAIGAVALGARLARWPLADWRSVACPWIVPNSSHLRLRI
jgi:hypothetical protein